MVNFFFFAIIACYVGNLSSLTRDWTCAPAGKVQSLNHWATGESPGFYIYIYIYIYFFFFKLCSHQVCLHLSGGYIFQCVPGNGGGHE